MSNVNIETLDFQALIDPPKKVKATMQPNEIALCLDLPTEQEVKLHVANFDSLLTAQEGLKAATRDLIPAYSFNAPSCGLGDFAATMLKSFLYAGVWPMKTNNAGQQVPMNVVEARRHSIAGKLYNKLYSSAVQRGIATVVEGSDKLCITLVDKKVFQGLAEAYLAMNPDTCEDVEQAMVEVRKGHTPLQRYKLLHDYRNFQLAAANPIDVPAE